MGGRMWGWPVPGSMAAKGAEHRRAVGPRGAVRGRLCGAVPAEEPLPPSRPSSARDYVALGVCAGSSAPLRYLSSHLVTQLVCTIS